MRVLRSLGCLGGGVGVAGGGVAFGGGEVFFGDGGLAVGAEGGVLRVHELDAGVVETVENLLAEVGVDFGHEVGEGGCDVDLVRDVEVVE